VVLRFAILDLRFQMKKVITIDGPAGSGKSTLARNLNYSLPDFQLVDMGAYFRWATYL